MAAATEELTVKEIVPLFHKVDADIVAEVLVDLNLEKPKTTTRHTQQRPSGGGPPVGGGKRARDERVYHVERAPGPSKGAPKGGKGKGNKGGSPAMKRPRNRRGGRKE